MLLSSLKKFNWNYLKYHLRWQSGIIFSWPVMYLLKDVLHYNDVVTIFAFQFIGATIYWYIDKWIFKKKEPVPVIKVKTVVQPFKYKRPEIMHGIKIKPRPKQQPKFHRKIIR